MVLLVGHSAWARPGRGSLTSPGMCFHHGARLPQNAVRKSSYTAPVHALPVQAEPVHALPVHAEPVHALPVHAEPVHALPVHALPVHAEPVHALPVHAEPVHALPVQAEPVQAEPFHGSHRTSISPWMTVETPLQVV